MTNEFIALELVKAWCMQPTTHGGTWDYEKVEGAYEYTVKALDRFFEERAREKGNVPCEEESEEDCEGSSEEGTDDSVKDYEKKFRSLKYNFQGLDWEEVKEDLEKGV